MNIMFTMPSFCIYVYKCSIIYSKTPKILSIHQSIPLIFFFSYEEAAKKKKFYQL